MARSRLTRIGSATTDDGELCLTLNIHTPRLLSGYRVYAERLYEHKIRPNYDLCLRVSYATFVTQSPDLVCLDELPFLSIRSPKNVRDHSQCVDMRRAWKISFVQVNPASVSSSRSSACVSRKFCPRVISRSFVNSINARIRF